jgi:choline dehydrogenase-like flavoprotein
MLSNKRVPPLTPVATAPILTDGRAKVRRDGPSRMRCPISSEARAGRMARTPWRGGSGPLGTQWTRMRDPFFDAWREAARRAGWPATEDANGSNPIGFGESQFTIREGRRASASAAYLRPILKHPNLSLRTGAHVTRITMRGTRASGVDFAHQGAMVHAEAAREVLLCGGVFNSPQLLMLGHRSGAAFARHGYRTADRSAGWPQPA